MSEEQFIRISSIGKFINWVEGLQFDGDALYRGMSSEGYKASASLSRRMTDPREWEMWKEAVRLIEDAKMQGYDRNLTLRGETLIKDFELLALLQHRGAATPLMDFSHNPLVALWFACADTHEKKKNGKVIAVNPSDHDKFGTIDVRNHGINEQGVFNLNNKNPIVHESIDGSKTIQQTETQVRLWRFNPSGFEARILAQSSEFILGKIELETTESGKNDINATCIIMKNAKAHIRKQLIQRYGISEKQLFRDLQGYASINAHDRPIEKTTADEYRQLGMEYLQKGEYDQAIENFNKALGDDIDESER